MYQLVQLFALPIIVVIFFWRRIKGKSVFGSFLQRIGLIERVSPEKKSIWIHAVSVGEIFAIQRLVHQLQERFPDVAVYVTTGTAGGLQVAKQHIRANYISYMPYDFLIPMMCAFKRIRPLAIIAMEAEVWPNFILLAWMKKTPVYLVNGRMNATHTWLKNNVLSHIYRLYTHMYAQTDRDGHAFQVLGVERQKISVLGNIKAYNVLPKKAESIKKGGLVKLVNYRVLMFASIHEGECDLFFAAYQAAKQLNNRVKAIVAPRHFTWESRLVEQLESRAINYFLWDEKAPLTISMEDLFKQYDVLVVCVLGKLFDLIGLADIFVLGGTFVPVGGHNLLEPAVWEVPMLVGPYYQNTRAIADELAVARALYKVMTKQELIERVCELIADDEKRAKMGAQARAWLTNQAKLVDCNLVHLFKEIGVKIAERSSL